MKAYKEYFDEENNKFTLFEFEVAGEKDFSKEPVTNLADNENCHFCNAKLAHDAVENLNVKIASGEITVIKCKDCGKFFVLGNSERDWYLSKNYAIPKRCYSCRKIKKQNAQNIKG